MGKRRERQQSFADLVHEVKTAPRAPTSTWDHRAGWYDDEMMVDQAGRLYTLADDDVSQSRALELAAAGAAVVWDSCGCGGGCGLHWYTAEDVMTMVASGPPTIRHTKRDRGRISQWRAHDGTALLLAEDAVSWGTLLA